MGFWKRSRAQAHPDSWIFGPKRSVRRDLTETVAQHRPPVLAKTLIVLAVVAVSAISALSPVSPVALVDSGGVGDVEGAGVPDGTQLTPRSGTVRITENGAVVDALDVTGYIYVKADDVTIRRTRVTSSSPFAIRLDRGRTGLIVEDSTLDCTAENGRAGVAFGNYDAARVEVGAGCSRGFLYNPNTTITDSYWDGEPFADVGVGTGTPTTTEPSPTTATTSPTTSAPPTTAPPTTATSAPPGSGGGNVKASCRNTTSAVNGTSVRNGFPTDATTGPEVGGLNEDDLTPSGVNGKWTITQDGTVIDGRYHNGIVEVNADNVTIRNSVICGTGVLLVKSNGQGLVVENSIIRGERGTVQDAATGTPCQAAFGYSNYVIRRSEISGCNDGLKAGGVVEVHDSWFHDNYANRFGSGAGTHNDTVQSVGGVLSHFVFQGNSAYQDSCTSNAQFQMAPVEQPGDIAYLRIQDNFFYGITGFNFDRGQGTGDGQISGNTFAGSAARGPFNHGLLYRGDSMGSVRVSGNAYEFGGAADTNPGASYQCAPS
jgi:hypothetical protein